MYYIYLIQCQNGSFYTGVTSNLKRRLTEHKTKSGGWHTKLHRGIKLLHTEKYSTKKRSSKKRKTDKKMEKSKEIKSY